MSTAGEFSVFAASVFSNCLKRALARALYNPRAYRKLSLRDAANRWRPLWGRFLCASRLAFYRYSAMNYPTVVNGIDFRDLIFVANNDPVTDSFMVAKAFRKLSKNVVRDIERTIDACPPEFDTKLNFELCYKNNELQNGKPQKFYRLRKDGLMLLVMSYTKKEAMRIKIAYINAFNWMYAMLQIGRRQFEEERNAVMLEFMKEKDVASMSGRLLNRWGRVKKPALLAKIERIEQQGQIRLPGFAEQITD